MTMHQIPFEERPRERLMALGSEALSTQELLAIVLGSGYKGMPVTQLAQNVLVHFGGLEALAEASIEELCQVKGMGRTKAVQLLAAVQVGRRSTRQSAEQTGALLSSTQVWTLLREQLEGETREIFGVLLLNTKHRPINFEVISIGSLQKTIVHPREVFYPAIRRKAASLILVHNHPSGDPTPSRADIETTTRLLEASQLMDIPVLDHLILGQGRYTSLRDWGLPFETGVWTNFGST